MKMISLFTLICLTSFPLHAGSVQVAQWVPWKFVSKEMKKLPLELHEERSVMNLEFGELKPVIKGFKLDVTGSLSDLQISKDGIDAHSNNISAEVSFSSLSIDQIIVREFNGNRISVELKATCSPLKLSINQFGIDINSLFVKYQNSWRPDIQNIHFLIENGSWRFNQIQCQGIDGVGSEIEKMLNATLQSPTQVEALLKSWMSEEIAKAWPQLWSGLGSGLGEDVTIIGMEKPRDKGLLTIAELKISKNRKELIGEVDESVLSESSPQLFLSDEGLNALVEDQFLKMAPKKYNLQKVSGFSDLMKSRMKQYFVWPDLRRFPSSTPFLVSTFDEQSRFTLSGTTNNWKAQLNANGVIQTEINSAAIDYINFGITVEAPLTIALKDSKLSISSGKSSLNLAWDFGALYQMIFNPNKRIAVDILKSSMNQLFTNQKIEQMLPVLELDQRTWKLQNWQKNQKLIIMDWVEEGV